MDQVNSAKSATTDTIERIHSERRRLWSEYRRKMDLLDRAESALTSPPPRSGIVTRITDPRETRERKVIR